MWTRPGLIPKYIHVHEDGRLLYEQQHPSYYYRTGLFMDGLENGNASMKIFRVGISDSGKYFCFLPSVQMEASIQLIVGGSGCVLEKFTLLIRTYFALIDLNSCLFETPALSPGAASLPTIELVSNNSGSAVLRCKSKGWYPEPEVLWLDGEGNLLSAGPPETVRGPDDLYTVSSRVTVEKRHSNRFTCRVQQKNINQTREAHVHVAGSKRNLNTKVQEKEDVPVI
ncbi:hypothetical protein L3Q82_003797 [Scortum barcoo]|uniref:Uncharacterized protein n=1 Tax=Scortum barcoo TaxID=214431 RepID=A0ACB8X613_9TELE|nr:hypothetical protein L3Q82_003797 [Scortum barcoo]